MIGILLIALGAITEPTFVVNGLEISRTEMHDLLDARIRYQQVLQQRMVDLAKYIADANEVTGKEGTSKDDAEAITNGANKRIAISAAELEAASAAQPTAQDIRRKTISTIYNAEAGVLRKNQDDNDTLDRIEAGLPVFIFDALDLNSDNELSVEEIQAYLRAL